MTEANEQTIVISDLLSFLGCKVKLVSKEKLLRTIKNYYSEKEISEAYKILFTTLSEIKISQYCDNYINLEPLNALYNCILAIPPDALPVFVCKNLNNVPELDITDIIKIEQHIPDEIDDDDDDDDDLDDNKFGVEKTLREEQKTMKLQIADIALVVRQLKDQLDNISHQNQYQSKDNAKMLKRKGYTNVFPNKKKCLEIKTFNLRNRGNLNYRKRNLKYIQKLMNEDEEIINKDQQNGNDHDSDNQDCDDTGHSDYEELPQQKKEDICEVILKEVLEDGDFPFNKIREKKENDIYLVSPSKSDQLENYFGGEGSLRKPITQKIIYIKNNDEDILEEEENSIEITSSSDYLGNLAVDPANGIPFELSGEEDFKGEIELMVSEHDLMKMEENSDTNNCSICGETFHSQKKLKIHIKSHCVKKVFDCILCDEGFPSKEMLRTHYERCLEITKKKYNLDAFPCPTCGRLYAQKRALKQHLYVHSASRSFACNRCSYRYLTKNALDAHVKTQHNVLNKYFCPFCDNSYISSGFLKNHLKSHTGERPYACKECEYKGSTPDLLKRHMLTHGPPQEYKCELCEFTCLGIGKLSRHKAREHKKENIVCKICEKEFNNSCVYHRHYMSHVGARPFPCSVCSYAAISKEVLLVHMRTHTGDNIINCPNCGVPFGTNYSLKRHLKSYCVTNRSSQYFDAEFVVDGIISH